MNKERFKTFETSICREEFDVEIDCELSVFWESQRLADLEIIWCEVAEEVVFQGIPYFRKGQKIDLTPSEQSLIKERYMESLT